AVVLLFPRPDRGVYPAPELLRLEGNQAVFPLPVKRTDMPNFFVEALTIFEGRIYTQIREIIVPPENRTLSVDINPSAGQYKPGEEAKIELAVRDESGRPFTGPLAVSVYDKAVEYISGGSNVPEIRSFFWKWRRSHHLAMTSSLRQASHPLYRSAKEAMQPLGALGRDAADNELALNAADGAGGARTRALVKAQPSKGLHAMEEMAPLPQEEAKKEKADAAAPPPDAAVEPVVRKEFADTAFWSPALETDKDGKAQVLFKMPDNLTEWKVRTWALGSGASVGENQTALTTSKNLLVRLQAPRFFVENDEVTISGNIHNYLAARKTVQAKLELGSTEFALPVFTMLSAASQDTGIDAGAEARVDWRLRAVKPGQGILRMFALSDEESDAAETSLPVYVHGMLKTESFAGSIRPEGEATSFTFHVPAERRTAETRLEVRYSPSLAAAMVDALPYLANYPYGCTEQTLNRFLPTVVVQKVLRGMKLDLEAVGKLRTNLNAQERGDPAQRKAQWQRYAEEPVFDTRKAQAMAKAGLERLGAMQLADGGWGWFSGTGERSSAHTTALVVRGLQTALEAGVEVDSELLRRGIDWLKHYQETELQKLKNAPAKTGLYKEYADNLDAFVFMVLAHADYLNSEMRERLYSNRAQLSVYAKAMFAVSLLGRGEDDKVSVLSRNIRQFLVEDPENGTAYLKLNEPWWRWYGSEFEAHAYYLKLLSHVESGGTAAPGLVKYLLNNRKHAAHWNSTRDTALVIEALADYLRASGETEPELSLELLLDGRSVKKLQIDRDNLFSFDNLLVLSGAELSTGTHTVELKKSGKGPIYYSANLENFTLEDFINRAGLEIKLDRRCYKLVPAAERSVVS
ncbi:MAG TPA: alpha-2-macroglobulin family protein, partial [Oligoflexia bacterium]|nr:alpha-2-macroglobulin family protein [Oligoflexia bacterium]